MKSPVYTSLQYVRGGAALAVVYFHAVLATVNSLAARDAPLPWVGACGVDLFFVLSGFVMWTSTVGRPMSTLEFYRRRIVRIVPLYWVATTVLLLLALAVPGMSQTTEVAPAHVIASYAFLPWPNPGMAGRPMTDLMTPLLVPGWTLNYEMFFYLLFGLVMMFGDRRRFQAVLIGLPLVMLAFMLLAPYSKVLHFYGSLRLLEFAGGVVLAHATIAARGRRPTALLLTLIAVGLVALPIGEAARWKWGTLYLGAVSMVIVWALVRLEQQRKIPRIGILKLLGDASFSIYLTHIFCIALLRAIWLRFLGVPDPAFVASDQMLFVLLAMIVSSLIGIAVHVLFERPVTRYLARKRTNVSVSATETIPAMKS